MIKKLLAECRTRHPKIKAYEEAKDIEWMDRGRMCVTLGRYNKAEKYLTKLLAAQPTAYDGFQYMAILKYATGERDDIIELFRYAEELLAPQVKDGSADPVFMSILQKQRDACANGLSIKEVLEIEMNELKG